MPGHIQAQWLADGTPVVMRTVQPTDVALIRAGFDALSSLSRYRRFFYHKAALTDEDLQFVKDAEGANNFVLGVLRERDDGAEPMGLGRLIRSDANAPDRAEVGIVVVDQHQGRGVGRLLMQGLIEGARARDIQRLRFTLLYDNAPMRRLIKATIGPHEVVEADGPVITVEATILDRPEHPLARMRKINEIMWQAQLNFVRAWGAGASTRSCLHPALTADLPK